MEGKEVMEWKLKVTGPALLVSSGMLFLGNKKPQGVDLKTVMNAIKLHPKQISYRFPIPKRTTLKEAINRGRHGEVGVIFPHFTTITILGMQHERYYPKKPETGQQLTLSQYDSIPMVVHEQ